LLQGIVLFAFARMPEINTWSTSTTIHYWLFILIEAITLVTLAFAAYCFIEKPGIAAGKKVTARLN
jgi:peptidoglycan/LPS O-acetylase OafA/YrhL